VLFSHRDHEPSREASHKTGNSPRLRPGAARRGLAAAAPAASAATSACLVVDTNANTGYTSLQAAVTAAAPGDTLFVKGTCTGTTEIGKNLTIGGHSASGTKTSTLDGGGQGTVLAIDSGVTVTLNTLIITGGKTGRFSSGGGIANDGTLTLNSTTVTDNTTLREGGGIDNVGGAVTMNGSSAVTANSASLGGGIFNFSLSNRPGTVTMNDGASITGNTAGVTAGHLRRERHGDDERQLHHYW
jgi:hypothetical protein